MYGLLGLLTTSGENSMSTAPLEIYLLRKMETCSILILSAVCPDQIQIDDQKWIASIRMFDDFTYSLLTYAIACFCCFFTARRSVLSQKMICVHTHARTHTRTHTHTHTHTHTRTHSLSHTHTRTHSLSHTLTHTHTLSLSLSLSLSQHTHTHAHTHSLSLSHTHAHTHSLSLSRTHTHTRWW